MAKVQTGQHADISVRVLGEAYLCAFHDQRCPNEVCSVGNERKETVGI